MTAGGTIVGDTIYLKFEVVDIELEGPGRGTLRLACRIDNQYRDLLLERERLLLKRRAPRPRRGSRQ